MLEHFSTWIQQYASSLTALAQLLFLVIWAIYLQMFIEQLKDQARFYVEIHHALSNDLDSACLLVNMGQQNMNVRAVAISLMSDGEEVTAPVEDYRQLSSIDENVPRVLRQGVLQPGDLIVVGHFKDFLKLRDPVSNRDAGEIASRLTAGKSMTIRVRCVVLHGSTGKLMGAERIFTLSENQERSDIYPESLYTRQLVSSRQRKMLAQWYHGLR